MMEKSNPYKIILKSTFLFGFVQGVNIITKVGISKAVAVLLGTEGMGVIGLLQSTISVITTACGLGLSQSAVKDISHGTVTSQGQLNRSISLTKKLVLLAAILGLVVTIALSPWLSQWAFNSDKYKYVFMALSIVVFLQIISEGQLAILKGVRMLRLLAKASLFGSVIGLFTSVPLYFWLGEDGIAPSLIMAALTTTIFSWHYVKKVDFVSQTYTVKGALKDGKTMIQMGIALMYVSFLGVFADFIIRTFIANVSDINTVGLFQAGSIIITSYFGIIITALTTDYYPRISAINHDNKLLQHEFNRQSKVGVLFVGLLVVVFMFAMPLFIHILYTNAFISIIPFLQYAVFGTLFTVCSNSLGIILLAKQASNIFFYTSTIGRIIIVLLSLYSFHSWGLGGMGVAIIIAGVLHLSFMSLIMWKKYNITMDKELYKMLLITIVFSVCAFFIKDIDSLYLRYSLGTLLLCGYIIYAIFQIKRTMNIDIIAFVKQKIGGK